MSKGKTELQGQNDAARKAGVGASLRLAFGDLDDTFEVNRMAALIDRLRAIEERNKGE